MEKPKFTLWSVLAAVFAMVLAAFLTVASGSEFVLTSKQLFIMLSIGLAVDLMIWHGKRLDALEKKR